MLNPTKQPLNVTTNTTLNQNQSGGVIYCSSNDIAIQLPKTTQPQYFAIYAYDDCNVAINVNGGQTMRTFNNSAVNTVNLNDANLIGTGVICICPGADEQWLVISSGGNTADMGLQ